MSPAVPLAAIAALVAALGAPPLAPLAGAPLGVVGIAVVVRPGRRGLVRIVAGVSLVVVAATGVRLHGLGTGPLAEAARAAVAAEVEVRVVGEPAAVEAGRWRTDVAVLLVDDQRSGARAELLTTERPVYGAVYAGRVEVRPTTTPWQRHRHVAARLTRPDLALVARPGLVAAATTRVRSALADAAASALPPGHAGLATGLVTGDTSLLPAGDDDAMRATGLTHLTAVSGSNVAMVVTGAWLVAGACGLGARGRRRTAVVVLVLFAVLTRADPSVLRASAMAGLVLLAGARGRRVRPLQALAGAVLVLVLLDPLLARRLGLLLSAAATLGVLVVAPRVRERLDRLAPVVRSTRLLDLLAVTIGAQVAVLPVLLAAGGDVALATLPANMVAVPAAAVASLLCTAAAVLVLPLPAVAAVLLRLASPALGTVLGVARRLQWWGPAVGWEEPLVLAGVLGATGWLLLRRGRRVAVGVVVACWLLSAMPAPRLPGAFVLTAIDVGQGDAFLMTTARTAVLVDTGRDGRAAAWLRRHGPDELDLLVLTHGDADHTGGAPAVLATVDVHAVWQRPRYGEVPEPLAAALGTAVEGGVPVHAPVAGQEARVGDLWLRVLAPAGPRTHRGLDGEENESSLVLRVDGPGGGSVLLTGDIGPAAHTALLNSPSAAAVMDVDVVTVPHHGSRNVDLGLYGVVTARDAVVSVGGGNRYGHPAPDVVAAVAASGARLHRTDRDGTVRIVVSPAAGRVAADAGLHPRDLRRPAAAAAGRRPCPARHARGRRRRTHRRRRGGPARRPHHVALRGRHRPRAAVLARAERRGPRRGHGARRVTRGHPDRGRRPARLGTEAAEDAARPRRRRRPAHRDDPATRLGGRAVGPAGR